MGMVTASTLFQTILIIFLLLLSKGWKIARQTIQRPDLSNFTMMMGCSYLLYSAYYVSYNVASLRFFIGFLLNIMYIILAMMTT